MLDTLPWEFLESHEESYSDFTYQIRNNKNIKIMDDGNYALSPDFDTAEAITEICNIYPKMKEMLIAANNALQALNSKNKVSQEIVELLKELRY